MQERQMNASELRLAELSERTEGEKRDEWHSDPPDSCDYCQKSMSDSFFFVDGKVRDSIQWANMCPDCFFGYGEAVRWGAGQLYQQVDPNEWLMVSGFPPDDSDSF